MFAFALLLTACSNPAEGLADEGLADEPRPAPPAKPTPKPAPKPAPAPEASDASSTYARVPDAELPALLGPHGVSPKDLAHAVFRGPMGPAAEAALVITREGGGRGVFHGRVIAGPRAWSLPIPDVAAPYEIPAVMFEDADGDPAKEIIILATWMTGMGPTGAHPFPRNVAFDWDGAAFMGVGGEVEAAIAEAPDAAAVLAGLARVRGD